MKHFPILDELLSSDSVLFLLIGLVFAVFIGVRLNDTKKNLIGSIASFIVYVTCEAVLNIHTTYMLELLLLFAGSVSMGCFFGFLAGLVACKAKERSLRSSI